jgi:hypothetical protein
MKIFVVPTTGELIKKATEVNMRRGSGTSEKVR